jgi:hypothetical protein
MDPNELDGEEQEEKPRPDHGYHAEDREDYGFADLPVRWQTKIKKFRRDVGNYRVQRNQERDGRLRAEEIAAERQEKIDELLARESNGESEHGVKLGFEARDALARLNVKEPRKIFNILRPHLALDNNGSVTVQTDKGPVPLGAVVPVEGSGGRQPAPYSANGKKTDAMSKLVGSQKEYEAKGREMGVRK